MHPALRQEFENLKKLADKKGKILGLMESNLEQLIFISSDKKMVCLVVLEEEIHNLLTCFKVDLNKWKWAEDEGYTIKTLPKDLQNEILIKFESPNEYLRYLGL